MELIEIKTLVDITNNKANRSMLASQLEQDQTRNFNTLRQCLELRSIIIFDDNPLMEEIEINKLNFGKEYKGKHKVWTFTFRTDRAGNYTDERGNAIGLLLDDIHQVPIIKNLAETINISKAIFDCKNINTKNTIIKAL